MKKIICRIMTLLLAVMVCTGLCTGFSVNAKEIPSSTTEQTEVTGESPEEEETTGTDVEEDSLRTDEEQADENDEEISGSLESAGQDEQEQSEQLAETIEQQEIAILSNAILNNPRIENNSSMMTGQKVTWDCVWFGSYPQAEVIPSEEYFEQITVLDKRTLRDGDMIIDKSLHDKIKSGSEWNDNNDITIDNVKYRRMKKSDAIYTSGGLGNYNWVVDTYHYFKYEPIKWRVLKVEGNQALLLSDVVLDYQKYHTEEEDTTWETSTVRSWLNGYGSSYNKQQVDYSSKNFIGSAFSSDEKKALVNTDLVNDYVVSNQRGIQVNVSGGNETKDRIFLPSQSEVETESYGFMPSLYVNSTKTRFDEARRCKSSAYAKAMGLYTAGEWEIENGVSDGKSIGNSEWCLRTPAWGSSDDEVNYQCVTVVRTEGNMNEWMGLFVSYHGKGIRVALVLDLSSTSYRYAGTVCSDGTENEIGGSSDETENKNPDSVEKPSESNASETPVPARVTGIRLSGLSNKIAAGKTVKLTADITPSNAANKAVTWTSSNTKVATVNSSGTVTMNKNSGGKSVTITATAKDGSGVKATYKITSMKDAVKKVAISGKKSVKAGKTLKLKVTVTGTKKTNKKVKWSSSNTKYATVSSSGKVKFKKAGKGKKVKITAMATDGSGKKKTITIKIK